MVEYQNIEKENIEWSKYRKKRDLFIIYNFYFMLKKNI